jgi:DnaJ-class molecular chaperone
MNDRSDEEIVTKRCPTCLGTGLDTLDLPGGPFSGADIVTTLPCATCKGTGRVEA